MQGLAFIQTDRQPAGAVERLDLTDPPVSGHMWGCTRALPCQGVPECCLAGAWGHPYLEWKGLHLKGCRSMVTAAERFGKLVRRVGCLSCVQGVIVGR